METTKKPLRRTDKKPAGSVAGFDPVELAKAMQEFKELQENIVYTSYVVKPK